MMRPVWAVTGAFLLLLATPTLGVSVLGADDSTPAPARPDLLIITLDTLRPDALGWAGGTNATPALDALARAGFRFPHAVAAVPLTLPSHTSIFTGLLPRGHGVRDNGQVLGAVPPTLAERLREAGYRTGAVVSGYPLAASFGLDRGFASYDDRLPHGEGGWQEKFAPEATAAALSWLRAGPGNPGGLGAHSPWFLWVHYYDPHYPYEPPAAFRRPGPRGGYDGEVAFADHAIGELLAGARGAAGPGGLLTVFAGDHGESLGEHGEGTHGFFIYDSTILVPLLFHWPGRLSAGESAAPARLVDLCPTVLALLGLPSLPASDGMDLSAFLLGHPPSVPPAYLETYQPWTSYGWSPLRALRRADAKLIAAPKPELYLLRDDPREERNRISDERRVARSLEKTLREVEARPAAGAARLDDPETVRRLRALGYVGNASPSAPLPSGLGDPKDFAAERLLLTEGDDLLRRGVAGEALAKFEVVLKRDPMNRFALLRSGLALASLGRSGEAIRRLEESVRLDPDQAEAHAALAQARVSAGAFAQAVAQWAEVVRLQPRRVEGWSNLGACLGKLGRVGEAVVALRRALELRPADPQLEARLGFALVGAQDTSQAIVHLQRAAELWGVESFPHAGALGILLLRAGRSEEGSSWLERSRAAEPEFAEARMRLARLYVAAGDRARARRALAEAVAVNPALRRAAASDPQLASLLP